MKHEAKELEGKLVVALEGDVDLSTSPDARKILLDCVGQKKSFVADLSAVNYIDSSGVASLIEALQGARQSGVKFALANVSENAMRVLELANLDKVFVIHDTVEQAIAEIG